LDRTVRVGGGDSQVEEGGKSLCSDAAADFEKGARNSSQEKNGIHREKGHLLRADLRKGEKGTQHKKWGLA